MCIWVIIKIVSFKNTHLHNPFAEVDSSSPHPLPVSEYLFWCPGIPPPRVRNLPLCSS